MSLAALVATVLLVVLVVFQLALALGAPLGDMSWGGRSPGVLPRNLRVASAIAGLVVYPAIIGIVLASAGLGAPGSVPIAGSTAMWVLAGFFLLGGFLNAVSRSRRERIWAPVSFVIALCCAVIALGA